MLQPINSKTIPTKFLKQESKLVIRAFPVGDHSNEKKDEKHPFWLESLAEVQKSLKALIQPNSDNKLTCVIHLPLLKYELLFKMVQKQTTEVCANTFTCILYVPTVLHPALTCYYC